MNDENRFQTWLSQYIKPLDNDRRKTITDTIRQSSSPGFDYFFLVILSSAIATLGLIGDSPAVIIGAMLVAPLMSPILGVGLGSITADTLLARRSSSALIRGALLSILLSTLLTLSNIYLPFVPSVLEVPREVLIRTSPNANDLIIALAGGLAAAYALAQPHLSAALPGVAIATALMPPLCTIGVGIALGRWDLAGGAFLLFLTNAVTIAFAATLIFFLEGFSPRFARLDGKLPRTLLITAILMGLLLIPLTILGARFVTQAQENRLINTVIETELADIANAELAEMNILRSENGIQLDLTIRSNNPLSYLRVVTLQEALVSRLDRPIALVVNHVRSERLDPLIPPTATPIPTATATSTPGPSRTPTATATPLPSATATSTATATEIPPTATPAMALIVRSVLPPYSSLYDEPGGNVIAPLRLATVLLDLQQLQIYKGLIWVKVQDPEGTIGWFPQIYLEYLTATPSSTATSAP